MSKRTAVDQWAATQKANLAANIEKQRSDLENTKKQALTQLAHDRQMGSIQKAAMEEQLLQDYANKIYQLEYAKTIQAMNIAATQAQNASAIDTALQQVSGMQVNTNPFSNLNTGVSQQQQQTVSPTQLIGNLFNNNSNDVYQGIINPFTA